MSTHDVAVLSGASQRQLQWWTEKGVLPVKLSGHNRAWGPSETFKACVISTLRAKGISLQMVRRIMAKDLLSAEWLLTTGRKSRAVQTDQEFLDVARTAISPFVAVHVGSIRRMVAAHV